MNFSRAEEQNRTEPNRTKVELLEEKATERAQDWHKPINICSFYFWSLVSEFIARLTAFTSQICPTWTTFCALHLLRVPTFSLPVCKIVALVDSLLRPISWLGLIHLSMPITLKIAWKICSTILRLPVAGAKYRKTFKMH